LAEDNKLKSFQKQLKELGLSTEDSNKALLEFIKANYSGGSSNGGNDKINALQASMRGRV